MYFQISRMRIALLTSDTFKVLYLFMNNFDMVFQYSIVGVGPSQARLGFGSARLAFLEARLGLGSLAFGS